MSGAKTLHLMSILSNVFKRYLKWLFTATVESLLAVTVSEIMAHCPIQFIFWPIGSLMTSFDHANIDTRP